MKEVYYSLKYLSGKAATLLFKLPASTATTDMLTVYIQISLYSVFERDHFVETVHKYGFCSLGKKTVIPFIK